MESNDSLIGFARVSTQEQDLQAQLEKLKQAGCKKIFSGKHSGKADTNKAALTEIEAYVRKGDTVVVTKLDRLGRSLSQVLQVIDGLRLKGVNLICLDQNIDTSKDDPLSTAMLQLLGMFSEMERNFIVQRTTEGKARTGNYGGRPQKLSEAVRGQIKKDFINGSSKSELSRVHAVSRATVLRIVRDVEKAT